MLNVLLNTSKQDESNKKIINTYIYITYIPKHLLIAKIMADYS